MIEYVAAAAIIIALILLIDGTKGFVLGAQRESAGLPMRVLIVVYRVHSKSPKLYLASSLEL